MIKLKGIRVAYGDNVIYDGFDFQFDRGVNVVVGASGSGKTTLLNVICGLVDYEGDCIADPVATVFQDPSLSPVSALGNVAAVLRGKDAKSRATEMLRLCNIGDKANDNVTRMSGGERQRVSLARAFAANRPVLLMDEPFHSLDLGVKRKLYATLDGLLAQYPKTVLLVTHDIDEALMLADRIYLLDGRPARLQSVAEIAEARGSRDEYSDAFIALRKKLRDLTAG